MRSSLGSKSDTALTPPPHSCFGHADNLDEYWELLGDVKGPHKKKMVAKLAQAKEAQANATTTGRRHSGAGIDETKDAPSASGAEASTDSLAHFEVFASMRFNAGGPAPQARELKAALAERGVLLHIIDVSAGENIEDKVFMTMEACDALIVFGSRDYGQDTGNPASTYHEIKVRSVSMYAWRRPVQPSLFRSHCALPLSV